MTRITVIFDNFGPYHLARLAALDRECTLTAIELHRTSSEYDWRPRGQVGFACLTLAGPDGADREVLPALRAALDAARPEAVFVPGWSNKAAIAALHWAQAAGVPAVLMSDSRAEDAPRRRLVEWIKRQIVAGFSGALVAGTAHREYARGLGVPVAYIKTGYDVVDNAHFAAGAEAARAAESRVRTMLELPPAYFLVSARFIEKKNLSFLLDGYSLYREQCSRAPRDLVIIGDGPLRATLEAQRRALGLAEHVHFPGFIQYENLPAYYGLATALVMPSTTDQWGLVVNEAMASGLPVLVSNGSGAAQDLVKRGTNGYTFNPSRTEELAEQMTALSEAPAVRIAQMGAASRAIIDGYTPQSFATAATELVARLLSRPAQRLSPARRALLAALGSTRGRT
jgi:glycosyltransferase involved in cell wall biosynthesis